MALTFTSVQNETICAIATGISESGIGIIRISGPDAIAVGEKLYRNKKGESDVRSWKANTIHFGYIVDPALLTDAAENTEAAKEEAEKEIGREKITKEIAADNNKKEKVSVERNAIVDEVMVSIMRAPHSYTTEDTIEINCHGGVYLMQRVLKLALQNGCRMAEPGEFTKRAFLGGRIDLSQAEAVMDLIRSQNEFSRKTALAQLEGSLSGKIKGIREEILYELAFIESALDDPENYSLDGYPEKLRGKCLHIRAELKQLLSFSEEGRLLREGIRTVIVGKPNVGKSSLLNDLAGEERAIVTDVAGTTRDTLEESIRIGDLVLLLTDTAGIHETEDKVEKIGVDKARKAAEQADLILFVVDCSTALDDDDARIAKLVAEKVYEGTKCIVLMNKSDLPAKIGKQDILALMDENLPATADASSCKPERMTTKDGDRKIGRHDSIQFLTISALKGTGLPAFRQLLSELFHTGQIAARNDCFLSSIREQEEAQAALSSINMVLQSIDNGMSEDFFSIDLMNAYTELGKITGESVEDDLVEEIFSKFCLGK